MVCSFFSALSASLDESSARIQELEQREMDIGAKESEARKQLLQLQIDYEGRYSHAVVLHRQSKHK